MKRSFRRDFDAVDRTADPAGFVQYLDTTRKTEFFQEIKRRTFALMDLHQGESAADIGCGTGEDVLALASRVGSNGRAVGVDISSTMITAARQRSADQPNVEFVQADVHKLPFPDACFDAVRAERLLQHARDPDSALGEMVRIVRPEGRIAIWEADLDLFVIDAPDYDTSRVMQRFICDNFRNGNIGHRLYKYFLDFGLLDVRSIPLIREFTDLAMVESAFDLSASVERAIEKGLLRPEAGALWMESLRSASRAGQFLSAIGGFITAGRRPGQ